MEPVPAYLASLTARSLGLFAVALVAIGVFRVKTAAARHAVWTLLVIGMLLSAVLALVAPALSLRMLPGSTVVTFDVATPSVTASGAARSAPVRPAASVWQSLRWDVPAVACYLLVAIVLLARLVFGYLFTRRLAHASRRTELGADEIYES
ncbi:MAG TPA: hypothetical protein VGS58_07520, partial [Candidatus Sulfopaludibacter sp.]|nr:hypothetical protein [Candidatus Sulfopaludibacter sp.]